jgi:hypothetical protein
LAAEGTVSQVGRLAREMSMAALGGEPMGPSFAWHDRDALSELMGSHGFSVDIEARSHVFTAASIDDFFRAEFVDHSLGAPSRAMLEARGRIDVQDAIVARTREILLAANEERHGFAVTRPYIVAVAQRS